MPVTQRIVNCLWFDSQAEQAANFYVSVFKNSKIVQINRYSKAGQDAHHQAVGSVMTVEFELDGQRFTGLNGGPIFKFTEAISLQIACDTQEEIDYYWDKLTPGGDPASHICGWLKDKYGLSWQVVPAILPELAKDHTSPGAQRVMETILRSKKLNIADIERAAAG